MRIRTGADRSHNCKVCCLELTDIRIFIECPEQMLEIALHGDEAAMRAMLVDALELECVNRLKGVSRTFISEG